MSEGVWVWGVWVWGCDEVNKQNVVYKEPMPVHTFTRLDRLTIVMCTVKGAAKIVLTCHTLVTRKSFFRAYASERGRGIGPPNSERGRGIGPANSERGRGIGPANNICCVVAS